MESPVEGQSSGDDSFELSLTRSSVANNNGNNDWQQVNGLTESMTSDYQQNNMKSNERVYDVIVVGAGISGLSCAKLLFENDVDVLVLEARDRVGGRTFTARNPNVNYVDLGGAYVGPGQNRVLRLIQEFGLETYKINVKEKSLHYYNGKSLRFPVNKMPPGRGFLERLDMNNFVRLLEQMGQQIPIDAPWNAPNADQWDTMTYGQFVEKNVWTKQVKKFARTLLTCFVTSEPYESSLLWFLWYIQQCGGTRSFFSTTDGGQERKIVGGSMQISEKMQQLLNSKEKRVQLNKPIVAITKDDKNNISVIKTLDGFEYKAKRIVLALAPPMHMKIHFSPSLPPLRNQLNQRCPMGSAIKSMVYYKRPFWRERDVNGVMVLESENDDVGMSFTYDDTKPDGTHPAIVGFVVGDIARKMVSMTKEERLKIICNALARAVGCDEARYPIHYEEQLWMGEQYSGGCYTVMCPPGFITRYGRLIREPIDNMHFAGTETATWWSGYMEGAVQAGERAAREVLHAFGKIHQSQVWVPEPPNKKIPPVEFPPPSLCERLLPSVGGFIKGAVVVGVIVGLIVVHGCNKHLFGGWDGYEWGSLRFMRCN